MDNPDLWTTALTRPGEALRRPEQSPVTVPGKPEAPAARIALPGLVNDRGERPQLAAGAEVEVLPEEDEAAVEVEGVEAGVADDELTELLELERLSVR